MCGTCGLLGRLLLYDTGMRFIPDEPDWARGMPRFPTVHIPEQGVDIPWGAAWVNACSHTYTNYTSGVIGAVPPISSKDILDKIIKLRAEFDAAEIPPQSILDPLPFRKYDLTNEWGNRGECFEGWGHNSKIGWGDWLTENNDNGPKQDPKAQEQSGKDPIPEGQSGGSLNDPPRPSEPRIQLYHPDGRKETIGIEELKARVEEEGTGKTGEGI